MKYVKKKYWRVSLSIGVIITMIRCVVYFLRIFKMFHGLMNNPVYLPITKNTYTKLNGVSFPLPLYLVHG
jgi:hypothetical protein